MEIFIKFKIVWIKLQNLEQKQNLLRTWSKKFQSKVSKVLFMSIFIVRFPWRDLWCNMLTTSEVRQMQSLIFLLWTKPLCSLEIGCEWFGLVCLIRPWYYLKFEVGCDNWPIVAQGVNIVGFRNEHHNVRVHVWKNLVVVEEFNDNIANTQTNSGPILL